MLLLVTGMMCEGGVFSIKQSDVMCLFAKIGVSKFRIFIAHHHASSSHDVHFPEDMYIP